MDIIEKDLIISGFKIGTFYVYDNIDPELEPKEIGEKVIPAPYFFERGYGNFTLIKRYEPGTKIGWPKGGYEVSDGAGAKRAFDLDQVICQPKSATQLMLVDKMKSKTSKSTQTTDELDSSIVEIVEGEEVETADFEPKTPGKRGRKPLSPEEKESRETEKAERAAKSGGKRGRPKSTEPKQIIIKQPSGNGRGRPALSPEEKVRREEEKLARSIKSGGKRGRPKKG